MDEIQWNYQDSTRRVEKCTEKGGKCSGERSWMYNYRLVIQYEGCDNKSLI